MKSLIFITMLSLFAVSLYSQSNIVQDTAPKHTFTSPWERGSFFLGVNSSGLDISYTLLSLSPLIGYAPSTKDMVYGSISYSQSPRISTFKLGWNRLLYKSLYAGVNTSIYGQSADWPKNVGFEAGVYKKLWSWLLVAPKILVTDTWLDGTNQIHFRSEVTFSIKL